MFFFESNPSTRIMTGIIVTKYNQTHYNKSNLTSFYDVNKKYDNKRFLTKSKLYNEFLI